jgi:predicted transcriptional regulator YheO
MEGNLQEFIIVVVAILIAHQIYLFAYFGGKKFLSIKHRIEKFTSDCNALNEHIEELKSSYLGVASRDYGAARLSDASSYKMKRRKWAEETRNHRTHNCSSTVVKNASNQPFKYLCKYFNIDQTEESLSKFEEVLNDFSAAEQGKVLLRAERESIISSVSGQIPFVIRMFREDIGDVVE